LINVAALIEQAEANIVADKERKERELNYFMPVVTDDEIGDAA
jgi:hypothetical protein